MKHFAFLAIFLMALVAMPVIASEPAGPPGFTEVLIGSINFDMSTQVVKEATPIDFDAVAVSTYSANDVERVCLAPVIGLTLSVNNPNCAYAIKTTLAGLMYGARKNGIAADKYLRAEINPEPFPLAL